MTTASSLIRKFKKIVFISIIVFLFFLQFLYVWAFLIEPNFLSVEKISIKSPRLFRVLGGYKIVHISDIHLRDFDFITLKLVNAIRKISPDIIFISGDLIGERRYITNLWRFLSLIKPRLGTFLVFGESDGVIKDLINHPNWKKNKINIIQGKLIKLNYKGKQNTSFWLFGCYGAEKILNKLKNIPKNEPLIILSHRPGIVKQASIVGADLVLAGHTHGSQVGIPLLRKIFSYAYRGPYIQGFYRVKDTLLFVNRGVYSEKHIRFFCPPQIAIIEFRPDRGIKPKVLPQDK